ncbi:hypothetical protein AAC387_Pa02g5169 [Persea americana]
MSTQKTVEHVVLFKVKPDTSSSKIDSMISNLRSLVSLPPVLHLTAGPIHLNRSSSFNFTHLLHSRYRTKEDLAAYSAHPSHLDAVKTSVLPICDDVMAVDWIADLRGPIVPRPNSAMRLTLLKLKESEEKEKGEILSVVGGIEKEFAEIEQLSFGENFSPARAKGFSIASIAIFAGLKEMEGLDDKGELVEMHKAKVRDLLEDVIVVDYVIPPPPSANL